MLGLAHEPAIELAERLVDLAPTGLTRVFYSDSGSTAVEIALKMAFQWWAQRGEPQRTTLHLPGERATTATRSARSRSAASSSSTRCYRPLLFDGLQARAGDGDDLQRLLDEHGDEIAAVIVEPLVQGAAGMLIAPARLPAPGARAVRRRTACC